MSSSDENLGLARFLVSGQPTVVHLDPSGERAWLASVSGRGYQDLPELLTDAEGDADRIEVGAEVTQLLGSPLPVVGNPGKVICLGQNYLAHVREAGPEARPPYPDLFPKWASSLAAPGEALVLPPESDLVDFEAELAIVIGRTVRRPSPAEVERAVFGYTASNDVSVRDYQFHTVGRMAGKAWDRLTPVGPRVVPAAALGGIAPDLRIWGDFNGEIVQDARTSEFLFSIVDIVTYISTFLTLEPGDLILTGTPAGVGFVRDPKLMLQDGDVFSVGIEGIGVLRNAFVREGDV